MPQPFQIVKRGSYCCPLECDLFGFHKTNSSYFVELDLARTDTVLNAFHGYFKTNTPFVPLAEITCHFLKEIKPFQPYDVVSRVVAVGEKWCYVISIFVVKNDPNGLSLALNGESQRVCAVSVGKLVFKAGRKTINVNSILPKGDQAPALEREATLQAAINDPSQLVNLFTSI